MKFPGRTRSYNQLHQLNDISLTDREIDIIACIMQGRTSAKSIASFLNTKHTPLSYRTVEHHLSNLIQKINGVSREDILDAVEKSNRIGLFRNHYEIIKFDHLLHRVLDNLYEVAVIPINVHVYYKTNQPSTNIYELKELIQYFGNHRVGITLKSASKISDINMLSTIEVNDAHSTLKSDSSQIGIENQAIYYLDSMEDYDIYTFSLWLLKHICKDLYSIQDIQDQCEKIYATTNNPAILRPIVQERNDSKQMYAYLVTNKLKALIAIFVLVLGVKETYLFLESKLAYTPKSIVWNLPKQNIHFVGRKSILQNIHKQFHVQPYRHSLNKTIAVSACAGLGGIGKTQLAIQYAQHTHHPYTLKAWFPAENFQFLQRKYTEFAEMLGFKEAKDAPNTEVKQYVKTWLVEHPGWLLIFDNAESYQEIEDFLPEQGGCILITSRIQYWPTTVEVMQIDVMTEVESVQMLESITKRTVRDQLGDAKVLVQKLGYLPLAISQAGAYIAQNNISIKQYLELYQEHEFELLSEKVFPEGVNTQPVAITWNICLEKIVKELQTNKEPLLAIELLTVCAFLSPDKIKQSTLKLWLSSAYPNLQSAEIVLNRHLRLLQKYSMIHYTEGYISIHRLIQSVARNKLQSGMNKQHQFCPSINLYWFEILLQFFLDHENEFKLTSSFEQLLRVRDNFKNSIISDYSETLAWLDLCVAPIYFFQERYHEYLNLLNEVNHFLSQKNIPYLKCKLLYLYSAYYRKQGQYRVANAKIDQAIYLVKQLSFANVDKKTIDLSSAVLFNKANLIFAENVAISPNRRNINELNQGVAIIKEAMECSKKTSNTRTYIRSVELYGRLEVLRNNPMPVLSLFDKIFKLVEATGDTRTKMLYHMTYADAYTLNKKYDKAQQHVENALNLAITLHLKNDIQKIKHKLTELRKVAL